jgi:hypothetical protein
MEVATTSQMHLGNIICECFPAKNAIWLYNGFPLRKMIIFRDEGRALSAFSYTTSPSCGALAHLFGLTSAALDPKGAVSSSTVCSIAVVKAQQP